MSVTRRRLVLALSIGLAVAAFVVAVALRLADDGAPAGEGHLVAYGCKERKNPWYAICVVDTDGSEPRRLTRELATTDPKWSPDGRRIAFTRNEEISPAGSTTFTSDDVFVMDADGGHLEPLTSDRAGRSFGQPAWSPDGASIVYVDGQSVPSTVQSRYGALVIMNADGSERRRLTEGPDTDPDWSPAGRAIVFRRGEDISSGTEANDDLYVLDLETRQLRRLTDTGPLVFEAAPAWSPDGLRIAFMRVTNSTDFDGRATIHVTNADGSGERLLLAHKLFADAPYSLAWSPDGRSLAFETSSTFGCTSISILDVASGATRPLTTCARPREATVAPDWQPGLRE